MYRGKWWNGDKMTTWNMYLDAGWFSYSTIQYGTSVNYMYIYMYIYCIVHFSGVAFMSVSVSCDSFIVIVKTNMAGACSDWSLTIDSLTQHYLNIGNSRTVCFKVHIVIIFKINICFLIYKRILVASNTVCIFTLCILYWVIILHVM